MEAPWIEPAQVPVSLSRNEVAFPVASHEEAMEGRIRAKVTVAVLSVIDTGLSMGYPCFLADARSATVLDVVSIRLASIDALGAEIRPPSFMGAEGASATNPHAA